MRYLVLVLCVVAGCTRVSDKLLIGVDRNSLLNVRDGSEVVLMVDRAEFEKTAAHLTGISLVDVFDNRSGEHYEYRFSAYDPRRMPKLETTESGMTILRVRIERSRFEENVAPIWAPDNYRDEPNELPDFLDGINNVPDSVCVRLHFADITNVVRSKDVCVKG